jgi:hypothetical protein
MLLTNSLAPPAKSSRFTLHVVPPIVSSFFIFFAGGTHVEWSSFSLLPLVGIFCKSTLITVGPKRKEGKSQGLILDMSKRFACGGRMDAGGVVWCCQKVLCGERCVCWVGQDSPEGASCSELG